MTSPLLKLNVLIQGEIPSPAEEGKGLMIQVTVHFFFFDCETNSLSQDSVLEDHF